MKRCPYCGKEYPDDVDVCPTDRQLLQPVGQPAAPKIPAAYAEPTSREEISLEEKRFWEHMTFRQFAILIVRIQAVCAAIFLIQKAEKVLGWLMKDYIAEGSADGSQ